MTLPDEIFDEIKHLVPDMLTPGAAEALAVKVYRVSRTQKSDEAQSLKDCLAHYQIPVPRDVMDFQIELAIREASDLEFVPKELLQKRTR
jgi:hypothetical protein